MLGARCGPAYTPGRRVRPGPAWSWGAARHRTIGLLPVEAQLLGRPVGAIDAAEAPDVTFRGPLRAEERPVDGLKRQALLVMHPHNRRHLRPLLLVRNPLTLAAGSDQLPAIARVLV